MTTPWDSHRDAIDGALAAIGELQEGLSICTDRQESAMGAVIMAVGQNPHVPSAQSAMNFTGEVKNRIEEIFNITEQIKEELESYATGI